MSDKVDCQTGTGGGGMERRTVEGDLERVAAAVGDSAASNTRRAYRGAARRFAAWLDLRRVKLADLGAAGRDLAVADYLADRADSWTWTAKAAGVVGRVSGHSTRVGTAQSLVRAGASAAELMQAGRWRDAKTVTAYAEAELAGRGPVARLSCGRA